MNKKIRRETMSRIRDEYMSNKDLLEQEPKSLHDISIALVVSAILLFIFGFIALMTKKKMFLIVYANCNFVFVLLVVGYCFLQHRHSDYREKNFAEIREIIRMIVEDEAKRLKTSREELTQDLLRNYEKPSWVSTLATDIVDYMLIEYNQINGGIAVFIVRMMVEFVLTLLVERVIKRLRCLDNFDSYLKKL